MKELVLIAAVARNGIIGTTVDGKATMPWRLPEDLKRFKALTLGNPIIMGRKTWESLGRPLPGRQNIVITRRVDYVATGATVVNSLDAAIAACDHATAFVIGGGEIYAQALPRASRIELTEINAEFTGDTRFPPWERTNFREVARTSQRADAGFDYAFVTYQRTTPITQGDNRVQLAPYLFFDGTCKAALDFYVQQLGGEISFLHTYGESPMATEFGAAMADKVMHATFSVAGQSVMASDASPGQAQAMSGFALSIALDDIARGEQIFQRLGADGNVIMPFAPTFWAKGFGMVKDKFGVTWMVNCE